MGIFESADNYLSLISKLNAQCAFISTYIFRKHIIEQDMYSKIVC